MKEILSYLTQGNKLSKEEAKQILLEIGSGKHSEIEISAFLTVYIMRKITPQELAGFREAMLELAVQINLSGINTIDVCGTGGDGKNTFNISTLSSFVIAGTGAYVTKHGNYSVSSSSGSSDMLEYLGYKFSNDESKIKSELETAHYTYLHAPLFHPAMKYVAPVRKTLKLRTFFNILGPMINPTKPSHQMVGVFNPEVLELYVNVYKDLDIPFAIVYSLDGYDEISLTSEFNFYTNTEMRILAPQDLGLDQLKASDLFGGNSVEEAAKIFNTILSGEGTEAQNNVVIANAGMALYVYHENKTIEECTAMAKESLMSGKAKEVVKKLIG
jgi:anthranilate phosphoribosyltransferase